MIKLPEKLLLALIVVTLLLPIPLTPLVLWARYANLSQPLHLDWITNRTLVGVTEKKDLPPVHVATWLNGDLQKGINTLVSEHFPGREFLIRVYNQILYRLFDKSYMFKETIIHGKHGNLFEHDYLADYGHYFDPAPSGEAEALVVMMKRLSKRLKELGSCFVFLITPSKATIYPEDVPDRYLTKLHHGERSLSNYQILVPLLKKYEVPYVDGRQITLENKGTLPSKAFPKTGTHWTRAVAFFSTVALLEKIKQESGREMPQLSESIESIDRRPDDVDDDLFSLLNLIEKPKQRYLHPTFQIPESWPKRKGIVTFVGGSFVGQIVNNLEAAQVFEGINYYFYFKVSKSRYPGRIVSSVDENAIPWREDFWNTTAVVLEANEQTIGGRHLRAFLTAELAALEQKLPEERTAEDPSPLSWGFGATANGNALPKKGFGVPDRDLTWISGREAEIDLPSPKQNVQLELILEAMPFLADGISERTVRVAFNGIPVGTLMLEDPAARFYSLSIEAAANLASSAKLHFSFSPNPGPALDCKLRQIGLARLALIPIKLPSSREGHEDQVTVLDFK
jgi:hypothetical protein